MKICLGSDHRGYKLKEIMKVYLQEKGYEIIDVGTKNFDRVDFPDYCFSLCQKVVNKDAEIGILFCGTGIGMSIAANKVKGIRAAVCSEPFTAKMARVHNNCNILAFGARVVGAELAKMIVETWLDAEFEGGRHQRRVDLITAIEEK